MGWDCFSIYESGMDVTNYDTGSPVIKNKLMADDFRAASSWVSQRAGTVDGLLYLGGLNVSTCAYMLEKAAGKSAWDPENWQPSFVRTLAQPSWWEFEYKPNDAWAYWSARKFVEICAKWNLGIRFSY